MAEQQRSDHWHVRKPRNVDAGESGARMADETFADDTRKTEAEQRQGQAHEQEHWSHHIGKNPRIWVRVCREEIHEKQQDKCPQGGHRQDHARKTEPVAEADKMARWIRGLGGGGYFTHNLRGIGRSRFEKSGASSPRPRLATDPAADHRHRM